MTVSPLDRVGRGGTAARGPDRVGQATAVEQARAVAEVAAAVQVAQQFPRDLERVRREMRETCADLDFAREAFYAVQNRGEGPSVHLARELASIFGNFQSGVHELRRDDAAGESEVQAFAWDVQRNTRQSRTFIHPHARMKKVNGVQTRVELIDLHDIYLNNQNTGARALRECIFAALPKSLVREAEALCRATIERGTGQGNDERFREAVRAWSALGIAERQLLDRVGRPAAEWTPQDFASLEVVYGSIRRGETTKDEQFPPSRITADEIARPARQEQAAPTRDEPPDGAMAYSGVPGEAEPTPSPADPASRAQVGRIQAMFAAAGITDRDLRLRYVADTIGREVASTNDLTKREASQVIDALGKDGAS